MPGESLTLRPHCKAKKLGSEVSEELRWCPTGRQLAGATKRWAGRKLKLFFGDFFLSGLPTGSAAHMRASLQFQLNWSRKSVKGVPSGVSINRVQIQSSWQPRSSITKGIQYCQNNHYKNKISSKQKLKLGWRNDPVIKSVCCSYRGPRFCSQDR